MDVLQRFGRWNTVSIRNKIIIIDTGKTRKKIRPDEHFTYDGIRR